jgi:hypothetical protein
MPGYSHTPIAKKLGIKSGHRVRTKRAPAVYRQLLATIPEGVRISTRSRDRVDLRHTFTRSCSKLGRELDRVVKAIPVFTRPTIVTRAERRLSMKVLFILVILTMGLSFFWGCAEDETPTAPEGNPPEFLATIHIDSCQGFPPGSPIDDLCGRRSDIHASFEFVFDGVKEEHTYTDGATKAVTFRTGPGTWEFSEHGCTGPRCRLSDELNGFFEGRSLMIIARRSISPSSPGGVFTLTIHLIAGSPVLGYDIWFPNGDSDMSVDAGGFPMIGDDLALSGDVLVEMLDGTKARGSADVTIKNWQTLPVRHKPEPPVVARPTVTVQMLRDAPETLEFGEYKLAFQKCEAFRPALDRGITVSFSIWEQGLWDFDKARLDFLWVVHESGEVWEPEITSAWDDIRMDRSTSDGPEWEVGTEVDVLAGFVDLNGDLWLMRSSDTIELSP